MAIDQLLLAAFFARKDTIKPTVVGFVSYIGYLAVAIPLRHTVGMPALAFANTVQNALRPIMLIVLLRLAIGPLRVREMIPATVKIFLATGIMIMVVLALQKLASSSGLLSQSSLFAHLLYILGIGGIATSVYFAAVALLKVEEITLVRKAIFSKLSRKSPYGDQNIS